MIVLRKLFSRLLAWLALTSIVTLAKSGSSVAQEAATEKLLSTPEAAELWCQYTGTEGPGVGRHIVLLSGDEEYRSEETMPMLGQLLAKRFGFKCTVLFAIDPDSGEINPDNQNNIPGIEMLDNADLVILGLRYRQLPDDHTARQLTRLHTTETVRALTRSTAIARRSLGRAALDRNTLATHGLLIMVATL